MTDTSDANNPAQQRPLTLADAQKLVGDADKALELGARIYNAAANQANGAEKGRLRQLAWTAQQKRLGDRPRWFSQAGQDRFLDEHVFKGKRNGVFMDVGAYDGATGSNTLFFEQYRGWNGLLVEPSPLYAAQTRACRRNPIVELAIGPDDGHAEFLHVTSGYTQMSGLADSYDANLRKQIEADQRYEGETIRVKTQTLGSLIEQHGLGPIDFISLDIEGGEVAALSSFDFEKHRITAWSIENNAAGGDIGAIMTGAGYRLADHIGVDEIYVRG